MPQDPSFITRQLMSGETNLFRRMLTLFGDVFGEPATYIERQPGDAYIESLLSGDQFIAVVTMKGDTVIGALAAYELKKFEQERSEIYIYDLAVGEGHRRKGIATGLIEHLKGIAVDRGAWVIFIQADHGDEPPIALYSKLGTREEVLHFDIQPSKGG